MIEYCVGNVLSIEGNKIRVIMRQNTNMFTYFYEGVYYRGITIGEYVGIIRGPVKIVARVEKEFLNDLAKNDYDHTYSLDRFQRIIEVCIVGYFYANKFNFGLKYLPMIFNDVVLLSEDEVDLILNSFIKNYDTDKVKYCVKIGKTLADEIPVRLSISNLFNTHIGIFGNTGSGKSNTLAKLYTELFNKGTINIWEKSKFIIIDFNGEYIRDGVLTDNEHRTVIDLNTRSSSNNKIKISPKKFWSNDVLSVLFFATEKTQQPFIQNMLDYVFKDENLDDSGNVSSNSIKKLLKQSFKHLAEGNNNREMLNLLKKICTTVFSQGYVDRCIVSKMGWHNSASTFYYDNNKYLTVDTHRAQAEQDFDQFVDENWDNIKTLTFIDELIIFLNAQLIYGLRYNHVQFDHINPLLARINSYKTFLERTIELATFNYSNLTIISFRHCNQQAKQILPLLICKELYDEHVKMAAQNDRIEKTCHLIIDEAHNILSEQLTRESESFKDYRLDVFEKIIKEGRKFGFYLTISSQRPYDISATIVSQIHNYFIHRLVNELDLKMIGNTISSLDAISKDRIPNLAPGQCILTGTSFELPTIIQVEKLESNVSPNSENADLLRLWRKST